MAYFGILSPAKLLPSRCNFGAEFGCTDYRIAATAILPDPANSFRLKLKNSVGEVVDVDSITLAKEDGSAYVCNAALGNTAPGWGSSAVRELIWTACNTPGWVAGDKGKVLVTINVHTTSGGAGYTRTVKGEVYATVQ